MATEDPIQNAGPTTPAPTESSRDLRRFFAIPAVLLAMALIGVGVAQLFGGNDPVSPEVQVGGAVLERDSVDADTQTEDSEPAPTSAIIGETGVLDVEGDGAQVGLVPAQTEER